MFDVGDSYRLPNASWLGKEDARTRARAHTHAHVHTHVIYTRRYIDTYARTLARTAASAYTHTHTHTHTYIHRVYFQHTVSAVCWFSAICGILFDESMTLLAIWISVHSSLFFCKVL